MKEMLELPVKNFKEATIKCSNTQGCIPVKQTENKREKKIKKINRASGTYKVIPKGLAFLSSETKESV